MGILCRHCRRRCYVASIIHNTTTTFLTIVAFGTYDDGWAQNGADVGIYWLHMGSDTNLEGLVLVAATYFVNATAKLKTATYEQQLL
mmetsp:Transcript_84932/g.169988  ORF Transcript_84932/g.169988 Transcript_84932/m.169988 type:complete len:87 (+) Transcript_84932:953-1213(+)